MRSVLGFYWIHVAFHESNKGNCVLIQWVDLCLKNAKLYLSVKFVIHCLLDVNECSCVNCYSHYLQALLIKLPKNLLAKASTVKNTGQVWRCHYLCSEDGLFSSHM